MEHALHLQGGSTNSPCDGWTVSPVSASSSQNASQALGMNQACGVSSPGRPAGSDAQSTLLYPRAVLGVPPPLGSGKLVRSPTNPYAGLWLVQVRTQHLLGRVVAICSPLSSAAWL